MILIIKTARHKGVRAAQASRFVLSDLGLPLHYCFLTCMLFEHLMPFSQLGDPADGVLGLFQPFL